MGVLSRGAAGYLHFGDRMQIAVLKAQGVRPRGFDWESPRGYGGIANI
jgi:hypothetical protein